MEPEYIHNAEYWRKGERWKKAYFLHNLTSRPDVLKTWTQIQVSFWVTCLTLLSPPATMLSCFPPEAHLIASYS